jgi:hypothetical protein
MAKAPASPEAAGGAAGGAFGGVAGGTVANLGDVEARKPAADTPPPPGVEPVDKRLAERVAPDAVAELRQAAPRTEPSRLAEVAGAGAMVLIETPGSETRWRLEPDGLVFRSTDAGKAWQPAHSAGVTLTAGASPSPKVCWLVGAAGTVLLTTDGERWEARPFPERLDLVAVTGTSARQATVVAVTGARWKTEDGGETWTPVR